MWSMSLLGICVIKKCRAIQTPRKLLCSGIRKYIDLIPRPEGENSRSDMYKEFGMSLARRLGFELAYAERRVLHWQSIMIETGSYT